MKHTSPFKKGVYVPKGVIRIKELQSMTVQELKGVAKSEGIKLSPDLDKSQIIKVLSDSRGDL